jgi:hypothetical protein
MRNRYALKSKLSEAAFEKVALTYFQGLGTAQAARDASVSQTSVKELYRRFGYTLILRFEEFAMHRALLADTFRTGGREITRFRYCLFGCEPVVHALQGKGFCLDCRMGPGRKALMRESPISQSLLPYTQVLAPLDAFSFVNRAALIYGLSEHFGGKERLWRQKLLRALRKCPLGSIGSPRIEGFMFIYAHLDLQTDEVHSRALREKLDLYLPNHAML